MSRPLPTPPIPGLLVAVLLAAAPAAWAQDDIAAGLRIVHEELEAWDREAARQAVDELAARAPDLPAVKAMQARVAFEESDYARAVALFDELSDQSALAQLARATHKETRGYESRESRHFVFHYPPGKDAVLAPYALEALEKAYAALAEDLGYAPPGKIHVEVYHDARALSRVSTLSLEAIKTSGTIAICKFNRLMVTSPKALVRGYDWLDTLVHEYVHLVVSKMSRNTVPIWIHEGLAKFLESRWRGPAGQALSPASAALLAHELKRDKLIPFERMHPSMALLPSQEDAALAFAEVFTAIEYLHGKGGNALLVKLIEELRRGSRYDLAVAKVVGVPFARFQSDWRAYLSKREFPKETLSLAAEKRRFTEDDARAKAAAKSGDEKKQEEIRFGDFLEIEDPEGRKLAHLGELLRQRNRNRAAAEEFGRAYERVGNRSPALSNRYAQALIQIGQTARAQELLEASLKPFPDYVRTHRTLGELHLEAGRHQDAERAFLEVVAVDPFDPRPHVALLKIYTERKDELRAAREQDALRILAGGKPASDGSQGAVIVRSHPFARVFVNGEDTGRTTPTTLRLPAGSHLIKLVNRERGFERESKVELAPGEQAVVEVLLDEPEAGSSGAKSATPTGP